MGKFDIDKISNLASDTSHSAKLALIFKTSNTGLSNRATKVVSSRLPLVVCIIRTFLLNSFYL